VPQVDLMVPPSAKRDTPFIVTVDVRSCKPGQRVHVRLEQRRGIAPFCPAQRITTVVEEGGVASASFAVALQGPGTAVLLAVARDDAGACFDPDASAVLVL